MSRNRSRKLRNASPRLEALEGRCVPAVTWDGGGATNLWTDRFNWDGDAAPTAGDDLVFAAGADPTSLTNSNDFGSGAAFRSISFTGTGYRLQGNAVNLGSGGLSHTATGQNIIDLGLVLSATRQFNVTAGLDDALLVRGLISGGGGIEKIGGGSLGLDRDAGSNTYNGPTTVSAGDLRIHSGAALGSTGAGTTVAAGARLELAESNLAVGEALTLAGGTLSGSFNSDWDGAISLTADSRIEGANGFSLDGVLSGGAAADLVLAGTLFVTAANTYAGFTTIQSGIVTVSNAAGLGSANSGTRVLDGGTLNVTSVAGPSETLFLNGDGQDGAASTLGALTIGAGSANTGYNGDITIESDTQVAVATGESLVLHGSLSGSGATLSKVGGGELVYEFDSDETTTFTGTTSVDGGTLALHTPNRNAIVGDLQINNGTVRLRGNVVAGIEIPGSGSNQISNAVSIFVGPGGTLDLNSHGETIGPLGMIAGHVTGGVLTLNGDVTTNASSASSVIDGVLNLGGATRTFNVANGTAGIDLVMNANIQAGSGVGLIKSGTGFLHLLGDNSGMQGTVTVNAGRLIVSTDTALGTTSAATTVNSGGNLFLADNVTIAEPLRINGNGNGTGAIISNGTNTVTGNVVVESDAEINVTSGRLTITGSVQDTTAGGGPVLSKTGTATLELAGTLINTFGGTLSVEAGVVELNKSSTDRAVRGSLFVGQAGTVQLGAANQILDSSAVTVEGTLNLVSFDDTIGALTMTDGLIFTGTGTLGLNGNVTTNASSTSSAIIGNLSLSNTTATVTRTFTIADGAALDDLAILGVISNSGGTAGLIKQGAGRMELSGGTANTYNGTTTVLAGTLSLDKSDGVNAIADVFNASALIVGDDVGAPGSARVVLGSDEQILNTEIVTVNRSGVFDLAGHAETFFRLVMGGGTVETGTGTLNLTSILESSGASATSTVNGKLNFTGTSASWRITDNASVDDDLIVNAVISGAANVSMGFGTGRMVATAANTMTGDIFISRGQLDLRGGSFASSNVRLQSDTGSRDHAVLIGEDGTIEKLEVTQGTVILAGDLTVQQQASFFAQTIFGRDALVKVEVTSDTVFGQLVANGGIDLGTQLTGSTPATDLQVDVFSSLTPGLDLPILVNNSNTLTNGRFRDLVGDPSAFDANGPGTGTTPMFVDYAEGDGNETVLRRNSGSMFPNRAVTPSLLEGGLATLTGDISDPDSIDSFFLDVAWGDGKTDHYVFAPGTEKVNVTHRYDDGSAAGTAYTIKLSWHDNAGEGNSGLLTTTVFNVAPTVDAGGLAVLKQGQVLNRAVAFTDPGLLDTFTATVDYGDGSGPQQVKVEKGNTLKLHNHYKEPGVYRVTVRVTDDDGGVGTSSFFVVVLPKSGSVQKWIASLGVEFADVFEQLRRMGY